MDENVVIAEFLRGEFYQGEFTGYRKRFTELVSRPDFSNERENILRKALLYRRRGRLWRELPRDTQWWEVELTPADIHRMRVFPRNQWLRYGVPNFLLGETAERIRGRIVSNSSDAFIDKLRSLSLEMKQNSVFSSVILITIDEATPITIIEGNHRMTAASLGSCPMKCTGAFDICADSRPTWLNAAGIRPTFPLSGDTRKILSATI